MGSSLLAPQGTPLFQKGGHNVHGLIWTHGLSMLHIPSVILVVFIGVFASPRYFYPMPAVGIMNIAQVQECEPHSEQS